MMRNAADVLEILHEPAHRPAHNRAWTFFGSWKRISMRLGEGFLRTFARDMVTDAFLFLLTFLLVGWLCLCLVAPFSRCEALAPQTPGHATAMLRSPQTW